MYEGFYLAKELRDEQQKAIRLERMDQLEQRVYEQSSSVVEALLAFAEIDPHQAEPPPAWVEAYGQEGAEQRLRIAKAAWLPQSVFPAGGKLALQAMTGISRGRAYRNAKLTQNNINVKVISLPAPTSREHPGPTVYEVRDLEE